MRLTKSDIIEKARRMGYDVFTWSPGDGTTRYRFEPQKGNTDYFAVSGEHVTALGAGEAQIVLQGIGLERERQMTEQNQ